MLELTPATVKDLAHRYHPILRFHESERFYPLLAEAWLSTVSNGVWPESDNHDTALLARPADPARRGAAFCSATKLTAAGIQPLSGPAVSGDHPINLDPAFLAQILDFGPEIFLDIGGWLPKGIFAEGDIEYLAGLTGELAAAINPAVAWKPQDTSQPRTQARPIPQPMPWQWIAQPPNITLYCEVTWAGAWALRDTRAGTGDYGGATDLDGYVAFTYYLLYGAREPGGAGRCREGQWEAITLLFRADAGPVSEGGDLLASRGMLIADTPEAVVLSQNSNSDTNFFAAQARRYLHCEQVSGRPVVYVTLGSHRNLFEPVTGQTYNPRNYGPHAPDTSRYDADAGWVGIDDALVVVGILAGLAALLTSLLGGTALYVAAALAVAWIMLAILILLIMWIVSACDEASDRDAGKNIGPRPEPQEASSSGPQAGGDGDEEPAPPAPAPASASGGAPDSSGTTATVGLPNTGSPTGRETSFPDIRIIERLFHDGATGKHTDFPATSEMENPRWWDYTGYWGLRVNSAPASGTWESGSRRIDHLGRDWGFYNGLALLNAIHSGTI